MKLTREDKGNIIDDFKSGYCFANLAAKYNVNEETIEDVIRKEIIRIAKECGL